MANETIGSGYRPEMGLSSEIDHEMEAINGFRIFVTTIGILGNLCVILMILILTEFKRGITAWYILQLAIADTAFLITLPFQVVEDQWESWIFPDWMCKAKQTVLFINYYCSISFLTIMAADRYIAICHSFSERLQKLRTHRAAYIATATVWVVSILISIPVMMYSQIQGIRPNCRCLLEFPEPLRTPLVICKENGFADNQEDLDMCLEIVASEVENKGYCSDPLIQDNFLLPPVNVNATENVLYPGCHYYGYAGGFKALLYLNFIVMFIAPFLIIAICYALIIRHLVKTSFKRDASTARPKSANNDDRNRDRVVIMCVTLVIVFTICWLPYHSVHLAKMQGITGSSSYCNNLLNAVSLLVYLNSAINPFIYFIVARFKSQFSRMKKSKAGSALISLFTRQTTVVSRGSGSGNSATDRTKNPAKSEENNRVQEADSRL